MGRRLRAIERLSWSLLLATWLACAPAAANAQDEETLYLLDFHADGYLLAESVPAYGMADTVLVDFALFVEALEFPIEQKDELWTGWFRSEDLQFVWRTDLGLVQVADDFGERLEPDEWIETYEGTFVSVEALERWFDLTLDVDLRQQVLTVDSSEPLPFQLWRERMLARYRYRPGDQSDADVSVPDQYQWATLPMVDLSTHFLTRTQSAGRSNSGSASLALGMDLLKHSTFYTGSFAQSSDNQGNSTNRLTISRSSATPDTPLFAGVRSYSLGDIYRGGSDLVLDSNTGRGFSVDRYPANRRGNRGRATVTGDAPPGWEVELYRNGSLIEFATVGADGRYFFPDQEIPFGENVFIAKLYGPQGQTREDSQVFWGGGTNLAKGDYDYSLSHIDFDRYLLDGAPEFVDGLPASHATSFRFSRALTDDMQLGAGYTRAGLGTRERDGTFTDTDYLNLFGSMKLGHGVLIGEAAHQFGSGQALQIEYLTAVKGHQVTIAHRAFNDFISPATVQRNDLDMLNEISLFGSFGEDKQHAYTLKLRQRDLADGPSDWRIFNQLSMRLGRMHLSNDLEYALASDSARTNGRLRVASRINGVSVRGQLDYLLGDSRPLRQVSASMNWELSRRLNSNLTLSKRLVDDRALFISNLLSVRIRDYDLTFSMNSDFEGDWSIGAGFSIAFGYDRHTKSIFTDIGGLANTGRATMKIFIDDNNDGVRNPGERAVDWASYRDQETLENVPGVLPLTSLPNSRAVQFDMQYLKLDDPFLTPRVRKYELHTHAGSDVQIDVAVVMTGDIEGHILADDSGNERAARGVIVTLHDAEGREVARTRSEFDGYYSFTGVPGGDYEVRVHADEGRTQLAQTFSLDPRDGYIVLEKTYIFE